jgi:DNA-binding MarR family transcriptional regulator
LSTCKKKPSRRELIERVTAGARASSAAAVHMHAALAAQLGLSATEVKTCDLLQRMGPLPAGEIGARTGLASASVTSLIDRLEAKGLVRRGRDAADRRRVIVEVTHDRDAELAPLYQPLRASMDQLLARYDTKQLETIADYLERSAEWAQAHLDRVGERSSPNEQS